VCFLLLFFSCKASLAYDTLFVTTQKGFLLEKKQLSIFTDVTNKIPFEKIRTIKAFRQPEKSIPNMGVLHATIWIRFTLFNKTSQHQLLINIKNPHLNHIRLYYPGDNSGNYTYVTGGNLLPVSQHRYENQNNIFEVPIPPYTSRTLYLCINSIGQIVVPVYVGTQDRIFKQINHNDTFFGIYIGIILIMLFYNLFIYFTVRDESYLYYIGFILFLGLSQFCLEGYGYRSLWSAAPFITLRSVNWSAALSGIATILFSRVFLRTREKLPLFDKVAVGFIVLYLITFLLTLFSVYNVSYILIDIISFLSGFAFLGAGIKLAVEGFRPAKFFMIAWSFFILSIILYVIKDFGLIPYNFFTSNILLIGSSIEIALLSLALADKINIYKKEKELSQYKALQVSREKEQFVKEQNLMLESKINERTQKLQLINTELKRTLTHLKDTQSQLVDAEKMASLGQLTAGIAHEINNPINFVKSNIKPLQLDIYELKEVVKKYEDINDKNIKDKLKEMKAFKEKIDFSYILNEIDTLLTGIEEGATRTTEIVKGLRTFSRLDEDELKKANLLEGIDTTLMLLTGIIPNNLSIIKNYHPIPAIDCYPGKLNQVFMNILTNAVQAIKSKPEEKEEKIIITTGKQGENVVIHITDTGPGISAATREKIFDPFFTTKDVGEGTGLGLSIVYSIIEKHHGKIEVHSEEGNGADFVITLPIRQNTSARNALPDMKSSSKPQG
jgi:signal transduction histidine kinase